MKSWLVNLAPVVQTLDSAIFTTAAQVLRACKVTTYFLNLTLCKFAILEVVLVELKTVGKFSDLYFGLVLTNFSTLNSL